jgi:hypothetical protein
MLVLSLRMFLLVPLVFALYFMVWVLWNFLKASQRR